MDDKAVQTLFPGDRTLHLEFDADKCPSRHGRSPVLVHRSWTSTLSSLPSSGLVTGSWWSHQPSSALAMQCSTLVHG